VYQQLQYTQEKDLGFRDEQVVVADVPEGKSEAFRREARTHSSVVSTSLAESVPGRFNLVLGRSAASVTPNPRVEDDQSIRFRPAAVDSDYVETLGLKIVAGRDFDPKRSSDKRQAHLLNETAARALGWTPKEAVGKSFDLDEDSNGKVIGVVRDFHTASLREPIRPVVVQLHSIQGASAGKQLVVRLAPGSIREGLEHIRRQWGRFSEDSFEYSFLDETFAEMYQTEQRLGRVFALFAGLAVFIVCLGLFGLAAYAAERRRREIAIRKVLGATAPSVVALLSKDFLTLVVLASVLAFPAAYVLMHRWLANFAYRIEIGPWVFVGALGTALLIALATVSTQALRAAWTDPATAIRQE
jgi:putative ABC transport system permease protein